MKSIQVPEVGGPEKLQFVEVPKPEPGPGEALVKIAAAGVNFIDIYYRTGLYKMDLPATLGMEAAGVVEAVGSGVTEVAPGDRVAYAGVRGSCRLRAGARGATGTSSAGARFPARRGSHAAGHDGALSLAVHLPAQKR